MRYPVAEPSKVTSDYGAQEPFRKKPHEGIDYINTKGDCSIFAMAEGVCVYDFDSYDDGKRWTDTLHSAGNMVVIGHQIAGKLIYIRYLHLSKNFVKVNQKIDEGFLLGNYADVGQSHGAHVHIDGFNDKWEKINIKEVMKDGFAKDGVKVADNFYKKMTSWVKNKFGGSSEA